MDEKKILKFTGKFHGEPIPQEKVAENAPDAEEAAGRRFTKDEIKLVTDFNKRVLAMKKSNPNVSWHGVSAKQIQQQVGAYSNEDLLGWVNKLSAASTEEMWSKPFFFFAVTQEITFRMLTQIDKDRKK